MNTTEILEERETTHGDFREVAKIDQALKAILKDSPNWSYLSDTQKLSLEMIAHKLSRIVCGDPNHLDHTNDIQGYAALFHPKKEYPYQPKPDAVNKALSEALRQARLNALNTTPQTAENE